MVQVMNMPRTRFSTLTNGLNLGLTFSKKLRKKQTLEKFIALEKIVLKVVQVVTMAYAMESREYLFDLMRIKKLNEVCGELKRNYDPTSPTAYDDMATFTHLEMDLCSL